VNKWLEKYGTKLTPTNLDLFRTTPAQEDLTKPQRYKASLPEDYMLNPPPEEVKKCIVKD
jgi:hypothetical protein